MTHHLNHDRTAAVSIDTYWLPIDSNTPRNVKVLAIAREKSGVVCITSLSSPEVWNTHWHPLPRFHPDTWAHGHLMTRRIQNEHGALLQRQPHFAQVQYGVDEKPGYFDKGQGATA